MDQTTETIKSEIDRRREAMTRDVNEIEDRAREMTDWEHQFRQRPLTMVAAAFGGGLLLGALMGGSKGDDEQEEQQRRQQRYPYYYESQGNYGWDQYRPEQEDGRGQRDGGGGGMMGWVTGERGPSSQTEAGKQRAAGKVDEMRGALMALAASKAEEFLREALPGFQSEVEKVRQQQGESDGGGSRQQSQQHSQSSPGVSQQPDQRASAQQAQQQ